MFYSNSHPRLIELLKQLGIVALYVLLAKGSLALFSENNVVSVIWPPSGLAMAAVLIGGKRYAWSVFFGALLVSSTTGISLGTAALIALGNSLEALFGAWLFTRDGKVTTDIRSLPDYLRLAALAGGAGSCIAALIGVSALQLSEFIPTEHYFLNLMHWWMGDVLGIILITPLILIWKRAPDHWLKQKRWLEAMLVLGLSTLVGQAIFLGWFSATAGSIAKGYLMFLFVTWATVRLGAHGVSIVLIMTAVLGLLGAHQSVGYFARDIAETQLANYWFYMVTLSTVGMALASYFEGRKQQEEELRIAAIVFESQEGMFVTNANKKILRINQAFTDITGYTAEDAVGQTPHLFSSGRNDAVFYAAMWESIGRTRGWQGEIWNRRKNGEVYPVWLTITAVLGDDGAITHYVATQIDITTRKAAASEIERLAFYDPLTRLPNRRLLIDRLQQALTASSRSLKQGALLFIDIDNFKTLNDTLGHDKGDLLLQQIAQRLTDCVRDGDTVARLGGDEFVVMLENLSENSVEAATQTEILGEKILATLNHSYPLDDHNYLSTTSIGVTLFCAHLKPVDELLKRADIAMYQAKAAGRNALRFFEPEMQAVVTARAALEKDLRQALEENQFRLYFQMQVTHDRRIIGAEALLRWQHPQRGLVLPMEFIPLTEETGLILPLGQWVLETACAQLKTWQQNPQICHLQLAVNVSARQFRQPDFVEQVSRVLRKSTINPDRLKLELTESLVLDNIEDTILKMQKLKAIGVHFSIDDFGTGYATLAYLTQLPLDELKVDQSFIRNIGVKPSNAVIVQTIIGMANNLGMEVIAEGVETEEQRTHLERFGCPVCQGYLFSRPVPLDQFEDLLKESAKESA